MRCSSAVLPSMFIKLFAGLEYKVIPNSLLMEFTVNISDKSNTRRLPLAHEHHGTPVKNAVPSLLRLVEYPSPDSAASPSISIPLWLQSFLSYLNMSTFHEKADFVTVFYYYNSVFFQ